MKEERECRNPVHGGLSPGTGGCGVAAGGLDQAWAPEVARVLSLGQSRGTLATGGCLLGRTPAATGITMAAIAFAELRVRIMSARRSGDRVSQEAFASRERDQNREHDALATDPQLERTRTHGPTANAGETKIAQRAIICTQISSSPSKPLSRGPNRR